MQDEIQSLTKEFAKLEAKPQTDIRHKIDVMNDLAWVLRDSDAHRSLALSESAHSLSKQADYGKGYAHSLRNLTSLNSFFFSNFDLALAQANEALELTETQKDPKLKSRVLSSLACIYAEMAEFGQSLAYNNQIVELCEQAGDTNFLPAAINDMGVSYFDTGDYKRAIQTYKKALRISQKHDVIRVQAIVLINIGEVLVQQEQHDEAKQYLHRAYDICRQHNYHFLQAHILIQLAKIFVVGNEFEEAIRLLEEGKSLVSSHDSTVDLAEIYLILGDVYQKQERMVEALDNLQRGLETAVSANSKRLVLQCHQSIANFYEGQEEWPKALQHYKECQALKDEISYEQSTNKLKTLQVIYETNAAKRETEIYRLKAIELEEKVAERTHKLQEAYEQLSELDHLKSKFIKDISHELRTPLATISLYLSLLNNNQPTKNKSYIGILKKQMNHLTRLAESITGLSTLDLEQDEQSMLEIDLNAMLQQIILSKQQQITGQDLSISFKPHAEPLLIHGYHKELTTLAKHIINNAINYTPKGEVAIQITVDDTLQQARLKVEDTGMGIEPKDMPHIFDRFYRGKGASLSNIPGAGLGLTIVKGIVMLHNGSVDVQSTPDVGTTVQVCLPLIPETDN